MGEVRFLGAPRRTAIIIAAVLVTIVAAGVTAFTLAGGWNVLAVSVRILLGVGLVALVFGIGGWWLLWGPVIWQIRRTADPRAYGLEPDDRTGAERGRPGLRRRRDR